MSTLAQNGIATPATCGYLLWCPEYSTTQKEVDPLLRHANMFGFSNASSSVKPLNTVSVPFGSKPAIDFHASLSNNTASELVGPTGDLMAETLIQDMRCLSACIRLSATGKLLDMNGEFAIMEGLTLESIMPTEQNYACASVNDLFDYANHTGPITKDPIEVKYRPTLSTAIFRSGELGAAHVYASGTGVSRPSESALIQSPTFFGIAWRGLDAGSACPFTFNLIKNVEFRLRPLTHLAHSPPVKVADVAPVEKSLEDLDRRLPGWQSEHAKSFGETLTEIALGAAGPAMTRLAARVPGMFSGGLSTVGWHTLAAIAA
jgi:hypothetical protein